MLTLCFVCSLLLNTISSTTQLVREWFDPGLSMAWVVVFVMPCWAVGQNFIIFQLFYRARLFEATNPQVTQGKFSRRVGEWLDPGLNMAEIVVWRMPLELLIYNLFIIQLFYRARLFEATNPQVTQGKFSRRVGEWLDPGLIMAEIVVYWMPLWAVGFNLYIIQLYYRAALFEATNPQVTQERFFRRVGISFDPRLNMA